MPASIQLAGNGCVSEARPVSLAMDEAPAADFIQLLSVVSGQSIRVDVDLSGHVVSANLQDVPWDCVLRELTDGLRLTSDLQAGGIVLRAGPEPIPG